MVAGEPSFPKRNGGRLTGSESVRRHGFRLQRHLKRWAPYGGPCPTWNAAWYTGHHAASQTSHWIPHGTHDSVRASGSQCLSHGPPDPVRADSSRSLSCMGHLLPHQFLDPARTPPCHTPRIPYDIPGASQSSQRTHGSARDPGPRMESRIKHRIQPEMP